MSSAALAARIPARRDGTGGVGSFLAALAMHAALVAAMWFAVQWRTSATAPVVAELWELPPPVAAVIAPPAPQVELPPPAEAPAPRDADIVRKQEAPRRSVAAPPREVPRKHEARPPAEPQGPSAEDVIQQQERADEVHRNEMRRLSREAGATDHASQASVAANPGPLTDSYLARVSGAVRAHLAYAVPEGVSASVYAEFTVDLLPNGEQASEPRLVKSSGLAGYDDAARRAILRTDPFPLREDGTAPSSLRLKLYPQDAR